MPRDPDDILLDLRKANGQWLPVGWYKSGDEARAGMADWLAHCEATAWRAFQFEVSGRRVIGRFVGTVILPAKKRQVPGRQTIGVEREARRPA